MAGEPCCCAHLARLGEFKVNFSDEAHVTVVHSVILDGAATICDEHEI